MLKILRSL